MNLKNKKIGIWGFGVVGTSVFNYVKSFTNYVQILDKKSHPEIPIILQTPQTTIKFLQDNDYIIPSPGIQLHDYQAYQHKFLYELDLFAQNYQHTIIAITGTAGKTTVTDFIAQLLPNSIAAGNIGFAMLDVLKLEPLPTNTVLELSSYQLQYVHNFAPDIAIWTNFFENHLDHHKDINEYFTAKCNILKHQNKNQIAIVPLELVDKILSKIDYQGQLFTYSVDKPDTFKNIYPSIQNRLAISLRANAKEENIIKKIIRTQLAYTRYYFTLVRPECFALAKCIEGCKKLWWTWYFAICPKKLLKRKLIHSYEKYSNFNIAETFYIENNNVVLWHNNQATTIFENIQQLPQTTFLANWIVILATLYLQKQNLNALNFTQLTPQPHRVEYVGTYHNVEIYNDSKSTIQESTQQAVKKFPDKKIALIIGGMSKGANREPLIQFIAEQKNITPFIFGKEKEMLATFCNKHQIIFYESETLEQLLEKFKNNYQNFDVLLFSPAGSSFDQFKNYQDRGNVFKSLIGNMK